MLAVEGPMLERRWPLPLAMRLSVVSMTAVYAAKLALAMARSLPCLPRADTWACASRARRVRGLVPGFSIAPLGR